MFLDVWNMVQNFAKKSNKYFLILCVGFNLDTINRKTSLANDSHSHELSIVKPMFQDYEKTKVSIEV